MTADTISLAIIIGSNREGRFGPAVADWFCDIAKQRSQLSVDVIDLADVALPVRFPSQPQAVAGPYLERIAAADAFAVVTPEYNHGYPAALKQAIDLARHEWSAKPVAFVSYGGLSGGLRAVEQLRQVFAELHTVTLRDTVSFHNAWQAFDEPATTAAATDAAEVVLDRLVWWATALRAARTTTPYAA